MSVELDESGGGSRGRALGTDEGAEQLERVLRSTVTSGHVGALSLDPKYFVFEAAPREYLIVKHFFFSFINYKLVFLSLFVRSFFKPLK